MRILHISKYYFPYLGGVENVCKYLVEGMPLHEIAVLCFNEGKDDSVDEVNGIKVYRVGSWLNIARQALSPTYFSMMHRVFRDFKPDIIHFHWANPYVAAVLLSMISKEMKLIVHWHMDVIKQANIYPFIRPFEKRLLKRSNMILVTSPQYKEYSVPLHSFQNKIRILPNAIDENVFSLQPGDDEKIKSIIKKYNYKPIVFFVGRHIHYKGLPYLIEAEKYINSDCELVIAGQGPLTPKLKNSCKSSRVHFVGKLNDDELRYYSYAAKIFAFPSITKNEAFGVALLEAMYCGTPAVTFTIIGSGVNWVSVNNETCLEIENSNVKKYAYGIDKLLNDKIMWERLSANGIKRVKENFTVPIMLKQLESYYSELLF